MMRSSSRTPFRAIHSPKRRRSRLGTRVSGVLWLKLYDLKRKNRSAMIRHLPIQWRYIHTVGANHEASSKFEDVDARRAGDAGGGRQAGSWSGRRVRLRRPRDRRLLPAVMRLSRSQRPQYTVLWR